MKNLLKPISLGAILALGLWTVVHALDVQRFLNSAGTEIYNVDDSGNVIAAGDVSVGDDLAVTGDMSVAGITNSLKTIYTPTNVNVATYTSISPSATYLLLKTTGTTSIALLNDASNGPAISTTSATLGQYLILGSTTSVTTVSIATGTVSKVISPTNLYIVISSTKPAASFIFNGTYWSHIGSPVGL